MLYANCFFLRSDLAESTSRQIEKIVEPGKKCAGGSHLHNCDINRAPKVSIGSLRIFKIWNKTLQGCFLWPGNSRWLGVGADDTQ